MDTTQGHTCTLRPIAIASPPAVCLSLSVVCALCSMFNFIIIIMLPYGTCYITLINTLPTGDRLTPLSERVPVRRLRCVTCDLACTYTHTAFTEGVS